MAQLRDTQETATKYPRYWDIETTIDKHQAVKLEKYSREETLDFILHTISVRYQLGYWIKQLKFEKYEIRVTMHMDYHTFEIKAAGYA